MKVHNRVNYRQADIEPLVGPLAALQNLTESSTFMPADRFLGRSNSYAWGSDQRVKMSKVAQKSHANVTSRMSGAERARFEAMPRARRNQTALQRGIAATGLMRIWSTPSGWTTGGIEPSRLLSD